MAFDSKKYLEYLDKEMTIMGILSAVAIAAPAGILNALVGDKGPFADRVLRAGPFFVLLGSISCVLAASAFYGQRSLLAWYYGQICLAESLDGSSSSSRKAERYIHDADLWETWVRYQWGFTGLVTGFLYYTVAMLFALITPRPNDHLTQAAWVIHIGFPLGAASVAGLQWWVFNHCTNSEHPSHDFWSYVFDPFRRTLPHEGVCSRLQVSAISGVGVFAISEIRKGTYLFGPDDDKVVPVLKSEIENLPPELRQLYKDFGVLRNDTYLCPSSFNKLTPSWYLNTSDSPNAAADLSLRFYTTRDIKAGEELTADYSSYSENESSL